MDRRTVLGSVGASLGSILAGCVSVPEQGPTPNVGMSPTEGTWPQIGYDARNTRHTDARGPRDDVTARELLDTNVYPPVVDDDLYLTESETDGTALAIGATEGTIQWTNNSLPPIRWAPALHERRLLTLSRSEGNVVRLHAFDTETGEQDWVRERGISASTSTRPPTGPTVRDDTLYISSEHGIIARSAVTGDPEWECILGRSSEAAFSSGQLPSWAQPAVNSRRAFTFDTNDDDGEIREVYAVDRHTGERDWTAELNLEENWHLTGYPVIGAGYVFVVAVYTRPVLQGNGTESFTQENRLFAIDANTGQVVWNRHFRSSVVLRPPAYAEGSLYLGRWQFDRNVSDLLSIDASNGETRWTYETDAGPIISSTVCDDTIYLGQGTQVAAISRSKGKRRWRLGIGDRPGSLVVVDDTAYVQADSLLNSDSRLLAIRES